MDSWKPHFKYWEHNCKESGKTTTQKGEPCNWCDVTEHDIELADMDKDCLYDPELI